MICVYCTAKNSKNQHNEFEIDTYDDSEHELEDDEETDNKNWSERLKNLAQKKQGRQYSASVGKNTRITPSKSCYSFDL